MRYSSSLAAFLSVVLTSTSVFAQICPASNSPAKDGKPIFGIGDGCTTVGLEHILPDIGIFRSTFTPSCNGHDKCLTTLGNSYKECNDRFLQDMRSSCRSKYNPFWRPVEYLACYDTTSRYYAAVELVRIAGEKASIDAGYPADFKGRMQHDAYSRSVETSNKVSSNQCGTTPELTTIYSASLIAKINTAFATYAGRKPTIYEFFDAVHLRRADGKPFVMYDDAPWVAKVNEYAAQRASVAIPSADYTEYDGGVFAATRPEGNSFFWRVNYEDSTTSTWSVGSDMPAYDVYLPVQGFLSTTGSNGEKNMSVINTTVRLQGSCGRTAGFACD